MSLILQVGKFYTVRNTVRNPSRYSQIVKIRVECIRADVEINPVIATPIFSGHTASDVLTYELDGSYCRGGIPQDIDLVAEYSEPQLELKPEHVGRRVRLRNGMIALIDMFDPYLGETQGLPIRTTASPMGAFHTSAGKCLEMGSGDYDIMEILP